ncbi:hypothetical protein BHAOGJBA_1674 [Methylobacterium hispanicum]|uniref:Uncharacterized protein n=1 Tax=Methylobacterium hispanicum TaxID=270350 RepID=A0AAV4ZI62_9HYPH|nr:MULTISPECIES: hypothetical protein [Methylobacterium]GJD88161.1 hypothetical protein BHAOGJBA_1674 [Methylobacterium hispanicum]
MAARRPLCRIGGRNVELPAGDTVSGPNALFTGVATLPALTLLLAASTTTFTVVPAVTGDALLAGEPITVTPAADIPAGLNIAWARVVATNQVRIGLTANVALALSTMAFSVVATR